ncbi:hypothetical protein MW327_006275, partial [Pseudomonas aeruginosa]
MAGQSRSAEVEEPLSFIACLNAGGETVPAHRLIAGARDLIEEQRRRAFLGAMQITSWLPRQPLPFAAP